MNWRHLNWLNDVALPSAVIAMEVAWLFPLLLVVGSWPFLALPQPVLSLQSMLLLIGTATFGARVALRSGLSLARVRLSILLLALLLIPGVIWAEYGHALPRLSTFPDLPEQLQAAPGPLLALLSSVYLFWRGLGFARSSLAFDAVRDAFTLGLASLILLFFLARLPHAEAAAHLSPSIAALSVTAFFAFGLSALSLANLEAVHRQAPHDHTLAFNQQWLGFLTLVVTLIMLSAFLLASLFSFDLLNLLIRPLGFLADVFFILLFLVLLPFALLAALLVYALRLIIWLLQGNQPPPLRQPFDLNVIHNPEMEAQTHGLPPEVVVGLKWLFFIVASVLITIILIRALFRYWRAPMEEIEEIHESVFSRDDFLNGLLSSLRRLLSPLQRQRRAARAGPSPIQDHPEGQPALALSVRGIYRELLRWAATQGLQRPQDATPYEFEQRLRLLHVPEPEIRLITEAYVRVRYNSDPPDGELAQEAREAWDRIRAGPTKPDFHPSR